MELPDDRRVVVRVAGRARRRVLLALRYVRPQPRRGRLQRRHVVVDLPQLAIGDHLGRERRHDPPRRPDLVREHLERERRLHQRRPHAPFPARAVTAETAFGNVQVLRRHARLRGARLASLRWGIAGGRALGRQGRGDE